MKLFDKKNLETFTQQNTSTTPMKRNSSGKPKSEEPKKLPPFLINTSSSRLVNEQLIEELLEKNLLAGYASDSHDISKFPKNRSLLGENLIALPRSSWYSDEVYEDIRLESTFEMRRAVLSATKGPGISANGRLSLEKLLYCVNQNYFEKDDEDDSMAAATKKELSSQFKKDDDNNEKQDENKKESNRPPPIPQTITDKSVPSPSLIMPSPSVSSSSNNLPNIQPLASQSNTPTTTSSPSVNALPNPNSQYGAGPSNSKLQKLDNTIIPNQANGIWPAQSSYFQNGFPVGSLGVGGLSTTSAASNMSNQVISNPSSVDSNRPLSASSNVQHMQPVGVRTATSLMNSAAPVNSVPSTSVPSLNGTKVPAASTIQNVLPNFRYRKGRRNTNVLVVIKLILTVKL